MVSICILISFVMYRMEMKSQMGKLSDKVR
uniref:Uncharacterized protein n=1 Tax=Anguilla anguilla TaxID=7936 RepID=A0A0E9SN30_ANGAN